MKDLENENTAIEPVDTPAFYREMDEVQVTYCDQSGYFDKLIIAGTVAHLFDYKFSQSEYKADGPQFWAYAVGIWQKFPEVVAINVHVLHPFLDVIDIVTWYRDKDFDRLAAQVTAIVESAKIADPEKHRTGEQCQYCVKRSTCKNLLQIAERISAGYGDQELTIPDQLIPENITNPEMLARAKQVAKVMRGWAAGVDLQALTLARQGVEIPGYALGTRKAKFTVIDASLAWAVIQENGYLPIEEFTKACSVSITAIDKMVGERAPSKQKKLQKTLVRNKLVEEGAARDEGTVDVLRKAGTTDEDGD